MKHFILLSALLFATAVQAAEISGTASVIDGDTIDIHGQRIRLHGIDCPEGRQRCYVAGKPWACGTDAANALADQIGRALVSCQPQDIDRYGRVVAICTSRGTNLNAWMVEQGWAVAYRRYSLDYVAAENRARSAKRGIWASQFKMPWDWRKNH